MIIPIKKISDVCEVIAGQSPEGKHYNSDGNGMPFYQGKKEFGEKYIGIPTTWTTVVTKEAIEGDILMSVRAPVGPVNFATQNICIGRGLAAIRPSSKVNADYLFYFLIKHESEITGSAGAVFDSINKAQIGAIELPLPHLAEQQQIVAILDEAFAAIDQAKANIEKNIANAKELFQSKLNEIFSQKGDGWEEKKLTDVIILKSGTTLNKSFEKQGGEIPYLKISDMNIEGNEFEITTSTKFVNSNDIKESNILPSGTIIFPKRGGAIATNKKRITTIPICVDLNTMGAIPVDGLIPEYLHFYFMSFDLLEIANGTTIPQINNYSFESLKISIPNDKKNQIQIIETLGAARQFIDDLVVGYSIKLNSLDELKKSILQKAFSGELTTKTLKINN